MTKKEIISKLDELGIDYDPKLHWTKLKKMLPKEDQKVQKGKVLVNPPKKILDLEIVKVPKMDYRTAWKWYKENVANSDCEYTLVNSSEKRNYKHNMFTEMKVPVLSLSTVKGKRSSWTGLPIIMDEKLGLLESGFVSPDFIIKTSILKKINFTDVAAKGWNPRNTSNGVHAMISRQLVELGVKMYHLA